MVHTDIHQLELMTFQQNILTLSVVAQRSETPNNEVWGFHAKKFEENFAINCILVQ